ncbi:DNA-methyltransferase [Streptomyces sp. NPDC058155]|uniref:DNA-methyltransferase n=1 Tax=Streptomyces sp. NPDC058155 TaxID=3346359 RepID=UPI0036EB2470
MTTTPYYRDEQVTLLLGDALEQLATLPDASVDAVVTDPPYEIGIAGQDWDRSGIAYSVPLWAQVLRVLKPGGHLLSFGAPRTYHRMVCAVEDAGFRVVDQLDWIYTHGKPKGVDLSRAIDRRRDDRQQVLQVTAWLKAARDAAGWTNRQIDTLFGFRGNMAGLWTTQGKAAIVPNGEQWARLREALGFDDAEILPVVAELNARKGTVGESWDRREVISRKAGKPEAAGQRGAYSGDRIKSVPHSEEAQRWEGWNTALKPAHDPILLARKSTGYDSLVGGLLRHGVGGLNITGCPAAGGGYTPNVLLGHDCDGPCEPGCPVREVGAAVRSFPVFRLESRTPASERVEVDGVRHDTPKPLELMRWLVRLVCPPGGTVLDWCAGSGTTLLAAADEGMASIGIERHEPYAAITRHRLTGRPLSLFDGAA